MYKNISSLKKIAIKDVNIAIKEDLGSGDITTNLLGKDKNKLSSAIVRSNEDAILCGQMWFESAFQNIQKKYGGILKIKWLKKDGENIKKGQIICRIHAPLRTILISERTALNFLQILSGISTKTQLYKKKLNNKKIQILDTRKTIPGLRYSQKYAVVCGGGTNHRFGLYDQVLIKENHIHQKSCNFENFLNDIQKKISFRKVSIEVETLNELKLVLQFKPKNILLDNFKIPDIRKATKIIDRKNTTIEVSGNINIKNIKNYCDLNINYISIGDLTKNIQSIDLSLLIDK